MGRELININIAQAMRADGASYRQVADHFGVSMKCAYMALNPEKKYTADRNRVQRRQRETEQRRQRNAAFRAALEPPEVPGILWLRGARIGEVNGCTIVDFEDWERFKDLRWSTSGRPLYPATEIDGRRVYLHRLILGLEPGSDLECDHINRNPWDNRRANLRKVTRKENCANRGGIFENAA